MSTSLVLGYCRKILDADTMDVYPMELFGEINRIYLSIILFAWDREHCHKDLCIITEDNVSEILVLKSERDCICLTNVVLDENKMTSAYCELELNSWNDTGRIGTYIGFVTPPISKSVQRYDKWLGKGDQEGQFAVFINSIWSGFYCWGKGILSQKVDSAKQYEFKDGLRIGLRFDFIDKHCELFYNGERVNVIFKDIPSKLILAVSLWQAGKLSCTKLEYNYK